MMALSGYAEWFWLIGKNWKDAENRPWSLSRYFKPEELPARFYLHASKTPVSAVEIDFILDMLDLNQASEFLNVKWDTLRGHIIGAATTDGMLAPGHVHLTPSSRWQFGNAFHVIDGRLFKTPIPYRGQLGFFSIKDSELVLKLAELDHDETSLTVENRVQSERRN